MKKLFLAALTLGLMAVSAQADVVTRAEWAATSDNGGGGGGFVFLNSSGADPFSTAGAWTTNWGPGNVVYSAAFSGGASFSNVASWNGSSSILWFGFPDTATYGQTFLAPGGALTSWSFLINNTEAGDQAKFVLAAWDANLQRAISPLYTQDVRLSGTGFQTLSLSDLNVPLQADSQYVAFLTVAQVAAVPEPSTWVMMLVGFAGLGFVARRKWTAAAQAA